jgi:hypothetical protein
MSMLVHGFVPEDETTDAEMRPDTDESLTYSVVLRRRKVSLVPALITLVVIIALFTVAVLVFG